MNRNTLLSLSLCACVFSIPVAFATHAHALEIVPFVPADAKLPEIVAQEDELPVIPAAEPVIPAAEKAAATDSSATIPTTTLNVTSSPDGSTIHTFGAGTSAEWVITIAPGLSSAPVRQTNLNAMPLNALPPAPLPSSHQEALPMGASPVVTNCPEGNCLSASSTNETLQGVIRAQYYTDVYNQIPFSRSEYNVNPSYRHDATIELLLGQIRPVTHQTTNVSVVAGGVDPWTNYYRGFWGAPWGYQPFGYYAPRYRTYVRW